jgi:hypothetical protein
VSFCTPGFCVGLHRLRCGLARRNLDGLKRSLASARVLHPERLRAPTLCRDVGRVLRFVKYLRNGGTGAARAKGEC